MAGMFEGREAIFRFLGRLPKETDGTYSSTLVDVLASDDRAAALYRATGEPPRTGAWTRAGASLPHRERARPGGAGPAVRSRGVRRVLGVAAVARLRASALDDAIRRVVGSGRARALRRDLHGGTRRHPRRAWAARPDPSARDPAARARHAPRGSGVHRRGRAGDHGDWEASLRRTLAMLGIGPGEATWPSTSATTTAIGATSASSRRRHCSPAAWRAVCIDGGCRDTRFILDDGLSGLRAPRHARGLHVALDRDGDAGADRRRSRQDRARRLGRGRRRRGRRGRRTRSRPRCSRRPSDKAETENAIRDAVRDGQTPLEAFERFGTF